jgi:tetratricopeptide (TPR) repeat protein
LRAMVELAAFRLWTNPEVGLVELPRVVEQAVPLFERLGDELGLARAWRNLADIHVFAGRWAEVADASQRSLTYALRAGDQQTETFALAGLAGALYFGPTAAGEGIVRLEKRLEEVGGGRMFRAVGDAWAIAGLEAMRGNIDEARRRCAGARSVFAEFGQQGRLADIRLTAARIEMLAGEPAAAELELQASAETLKEMGEKSVLPTVMGELAEAVYVQGRYEEAERLASEVEEGAADDDADSQVRWRTTSARIRARQGRLDEAEALAREAVALSTQTDFLNLQGSAFMALAEVLAAAREPDQAAAAARDALAVYETKGNVVSAAEARKFVESVI